MKYSHGALLWVVDGAPGSKRPAKRNEDRARKMLVQCSAVCDATQCNATTVVFANTTQM